MGPFQVHVMIASGLCFMADSMEIVLLSLLSLAVSVEWDLTPYQTSTITSSIFAGEFVGTLVLGRLGDLLGRKPIFILTAGIIAIFGLGTAATQTYHQLCFVRFMVGFGVGGISVPYDSLAELIPNTEQRGQRLVYTSYFWTAANIFVPLVASFTLQNNNEEDGDDGTVNWRLFVTICAIPCVISTIVGISIVPESPRWLITVKHDSTRALSILRRAALINGRDPFKTFPSNTQFKIVQMDENSQDVYRLLLARERRATTLWLWLLWLCTAALYYGIILAVTLVFSGSMDSSSNSFEVDFRALVVTASAEVAGVTLVILSVDRIGRIRSQMAWFSICGLSVLGLCMLKASSSSISEGHGILVALGFGARMFALSATSVVWITTAEVLTTDIRTTGHSVANAVGRIGGFMSPYLVSSTTPVTTIGVVMFAISILAAFCAWNLPETGGRPMDRMMDPSTSTNACPNNAESVPTNEPSID